MTINEYMRLSAVSLHTPRCVSYNGHLWVPYWTPGMRTVELNRYVRVKGNYRTTKHTRRIRRVVSLDINVTPATEKRGQMIY